MDVNVVYVESIEDLEVLKTCIHKEGVFLYAIPESTNKHPVTDNVSILFIKTLFKDNIFIIPFNHVDGECNVDVESVSDIINIFTSKRLVLNKKSFCQLINICDTIDINILSYVASQEIIDDSINVTTSHIFYNQRFPRCNSLNRIIPVNKHLEKFKILYEYSEELISNNESLLNLESFTHLNNNIISSLTHVESNGLKVLNDKYVGAFGDDSKHLIKNGFVYSQYNIFTSTEDLQILLEV